MTHSPTAAQTLRAIGQDLEARHVNVFELKRQGKDYIVQAKVENGSVDQSLLGRWKENGLRSILRALQLQNGGHRKTSDESNGAETLRLCYTPEEISRLERQGQERRGRGSGAMELLNLSQILRAVGAYIDQKGGRLIALSRRDQFGDLHSVTLEYETYRGERREEERLFSNLYDWSVHLYKQRNRVSARVL